MMTRLEFTVASSHLDKSRSRRQREAGGCSISKKPAIWLLACLFAWTASGSSRADIYRWDNGNVIPGTQGITPGPGVDLSYWNTAARNLRFADFSGGLDLTGSNFYFSWVDDADFSGANLTSAYFAESTLTNANLTGANLTSADLELPRSRTRT